MISRARSDAGPPVVFAITGASGAPYAVRLLEQLVGARVRVSLIVSAHGWRLLGDETEFKDAEALRWRVGPDSWDEFVTEHNDADRGAAPASGSAPSRGMIICPCSMGTLSAVSVGASRSLIERSADVALKERRKLLLVTRETPLSSIHLRNMLRLSLAGATVIPASPAFYTHPSSIDDMVDFVVARVLDHLEVPHELSRRWSGKSLKA